MASLPDLAQSKKELRAQLKEQRRALPASDRAHMDALIARNVLALPAYAQAPVLLAYLSFGAEVQTRPLIEDAWAQGKTVALPYCVPGTRTMRWYAVTSFNDLVRSPLGVLEPDPQTAPLLLDETEPAPASALALVPGLTFDPQGYRLGYGGGFYDVFLQHFPGTAVGLCREVALSPAVPCLDPHDLPVDLVVTNTRIIPAKQGA